MNRRTMGTKLVLLTGWMLLALASVRCGPEANTPCAKDTDCKGDRVCTNGQCTQPPQCPDSCTKDDDCKVCASDKQSCVDGKCAQAPQCPDSCQSDNDCAQCPASQQKCLNKKCSLPPLSTEEVTIEAGSFTMGSPATELGRDDDETTHKVTFTYKFSLWKYEVTQGDFQKLMDYNPSSFSSCGNNCPVERVSWHEAAAFCNALSRNQDLPECYDCSLTTASDKTSWQCIVKKEFQGNDGKDYVTCKGYRLPTEAEWEYAYRAGTTTALYNGELTQTVCKEDPNATKIAWYCGNSSDQPHPVGQKAPNAWGLYDMAGNVYERVHDWYNASYPTQAVENPVGPSTGTARVHRGGGWSYNAEHTRAADRSSGAPTYRAHDVGFRPARTLSK